MAQGCFLNYGYTFEGINVYLMSHAEIKELVRLCPFYRFPVGSGDIEERGVIVWPEDAGWDPDYVGCSSEFEWQNI